MNRQTYRSVLILASAAFGLAACVSTASTRSAGETIDDSTLNARVKTALIGDERTKARQIDVDTYRGDVQLNGFVDSAAAKTAAASVAQNVDGVAKVTNNLQVGADRTTGEVVDDSTINSRVRAALIGDERTKAHQINVETNHSVVLLAGFVANSTSRSAAGDIARSITGVKLVDNQIAIK